jgi:hypothetical protein
MPWSGVIDAIARCKSRSIACVHKRRFVLAWRWICGVKLKPKVVNKPSHHSIRPELDKPGVFTTVSVFVLAILEENISVEATILITVSLFAVRGVIVGVLYYIDLRKTFHRGVLTTIVDTMFWVRHPFNSNAYLRRRDETLRKEKGE